MRAMMEYRLKWNVNGPIKLPLAATGIFSASIPVSSKYMRKTYFGCHLFLAAFFAAASANAADIGHAPQSLLQLLQRAGYEHIRDIDFDDGLWEAEVRRESGWWREIAVHPDTGEIYDARSGRALLGGKEAMRSLRKQGYSSVTELERHGATWKAEVRDASNHCFDVTISGYDGSLLHQQAEDDCGRH